jgi:threonine dehydratase
MSGADVYLKLECLQRTGSFKPRGALYAINKLSEEQKAKGVVAASAGNHAQGGTNYSYFSSQISRSPVAYGASILGIPATIYMPVIAPVAKQRATKAYGAEVVLYGPTLAQALQKAQEDSEATGATFIHPYNNENVVCGQGTVGLGM